MTTNHVFITGGSRGIGAAAVLAFARAGYDVAFTYNAHPDAAEAVLRRAAAAAQGAEPEPASLENRPRFTPFMSTAPKPPAAIWRSPKASAKILANTPGTLLKWVAMINRVITK